MARALIACLVHVAVLAVSLSVSSAQEVKEQATSFAGPQIVAALVDPAEKLFVWRDVRIQLTIINGNSPVGIEAIAVAVPPGTAWASDAADGHRPADSVSVAVEPFEMKTPGEKRDLGIVYVRAADWPALRADHFGFLVYRPRKEVVLVSMTYRPLADATAAPRVQSARLEATVSAHPLGMYAGALVGVVLATALVACYRVTKKVQASSSPRDEAHAPADPASQAQGVVAEGAPWWLRLVRGSLASLIAILLFQTTSDISFPISVTVHDFYGGVLLGLFGDKVAESIWSRI